ncbi:unnamed protein product [Caenorhabditis bovis]|uniref:Uncharacterized protein n=1 Tax=Caenorhabditis bovis TaxID=2654633 RepID=A0A8S1EXT4_9PELO|nr:unnamed protein product [Caenorhabditis bovis]
MAPDYEMIYQTLKSILEKSGGGWMDPYDWETETLPSYTKWKEEKNKQKIIYKWEDNTDFFKTDFGLQTDPWEYLPRPMKRVRSNELIDKEKEKAKEKEKEKIDKPSKEGQKKGSKDDVKEGMKKGSKDEVKENNKEAYRKGSKDDLREKEKEGEKKEDERKEERKEEEERKDENKDEKKQIPMRWKINQTRKLSREQITADDVADDYVYCPPPPRRSGISSRSSPSPVSVMNMSAEIVNLSIQQNIDEVIEQGSKANGTTPVLLRKASTKKKKKSGRSERKGGFTRMIKAIVKKK